MTRLIVRALLAIAVALPLCGCTLIGLGIGHQVDKHSSRRPQPVARGDVDLLKVGEEIEVQLWDGRTLLGKYQGLEWALPAEYGPRYEAARKELEPEVTLPALGPGARLVVTSGGSAVGDFRGVGPGFVRFVEPGLPEASIKTHRIVTLTDASGHGVSGGALDKLLAEWRLPMLTSLRIEASPSNHVVDHIEVAGVSRLKRPSSGKKQGALIGLAIDAAVVAITVHQFGQMIYFSDPCPNNGGDMRCRALVFAK
jgi:hypothetical protein